MKLEKAIAEIQRIYDLPTIYAAGIAILIRTEGLMPQVMLDDVKQALEAHGMMGVVIENPEGNEP